MVKEYRHTQQEIVKELSRYEAVFGQVLARSIWDLDRERIDENLDVLFNMPVIVGIKIRKPNEDTIFMAKGIVSHDNEIRSFLNSEIDIDDISELLSYDFPLNYNFSGKKIKLADVTLYSDFNVVLSRVELGFTFLIVNSFIKSLSLLIIFYIFSKYILLNPLRSLTNKIHAIKFDNLHDYKSDFEESKVPNEIDELNSSFNGLVSELSHSKDELLSVKERLEKDVLDRTSELQQALDVKTRFLATISHEIRTPMNGVIGMLDLLNKNNSDKKNKRYIKLAQESADTLLSLVNDVLDFSKIEAGKLNLEEHVFDMDFLVHAIFENYKHQTRNKEIDLILDAVTIRDLWVKGDSIRLKQVIGNLLSNAIKFTEKGSVTLKINVNKINEEKITLIISVIDTGIGLDSENITNVFSDFTQADSSTTRRFGGTGLGLAIVNQLVELMGGKIHVRSELNVGSEFTVELPINIAKHTELVLQNDESESLVYQGKVLLVEDNLINQEVAKELLADLGLTVCIANNGEEAIEQIKKNTFDVVFMDCQMPVMDGYSATEAIRSGAADTQTASNKEIPIIAMTANAIGGDKEKCLACGMNDYLSKPIEGEELNRVLLKYINPHD